jgi:hypothetical protein
MDFLRVPLLSNISDLTGFDIIYFFLSSSLLPSRSSRLRGSLNKNFSDTKTP